MSLRPLNVLSLLVALVSLAGFAVPASHANAADKPNILFIYLDDFGWKDTSYMGSDFFETPHLDALAAKGMVFTNAYAGAANCAPARACLLSGQYAPRHEIYNVGTGPRGKEAHRRLLHVPGTADLREDIVTWAEALQAGGYRTASMGKWHLSSDPTDHGFDINVGGTHSGGPPKGYYPPHPRAPGLEEAPEGEYITDRLSSEAITFIEASKGQPWLLYLTHFAVHTPLDAKKELVAKYKAKTPGKLHDHVAMATMIQAVDDGVGRIIQALEESGQADNTAIFFYSDNGGYGPATDMAPLKGYKGTYYEGGIRVPMFATWPGVVKAGSRCEVPVTGVDFHPTFCEMAGLPSPSQPVDGVSLVPLLKGERPASLTDRPIFWHFPAYLQSYSVFDEQRDPLFRARPCSVVRQGKWKLLEFFEDGALELYDLEADISESKDLASENPEQARSLHETLKSWRTATKAPIPSDPNPNFDAEVEAKAIESALAKQRKKG